jgi:hypothetical protein
MKNCMPDTRARGIKSVASSCDLLTSAQPSSQLGCYVQLEVVQQQQHRARACRLCMYIYMWSLSGILQRQPTLMCVIYFCTFSDQHAVITQLDQVWLGVRLVPNTMIWRELLKMSVLIGIWVKWCSLKPKTTNINGHVPTNQLVILQPI